MQSFMEILGVRDGMRVLDLGGQPMIWDSVPAKLEITLLNRPDVAEAAHPTHHAIRYVEGDARRVEAFADASFDTVFSNSVIEHVGDEKDRAAFAREVRRLGASYWVQTPSKWFPIEAHCGMPFWWFYPRALRRFFIERWRKKLPAWTEMVEETTVLSKGELQRLFPDAAIIVERLWGMPKSYIAWRDGRGRK